MAEDSFWESEDTMTEEEANEALEQIQEQEEVVEEEQTEEVEASEETQEEEDVEADLQVLKDASLRLEQGNLYKMLLKHDLFEGVEADPRAIANVQRELRAFIRERLEILVGLKSDPKIAPKTVQAQLPFSDLEIQLLKEFLSKVTGKTEQPKPATMRPAAVQQPAAAKIKPVLGASNNVKVAAPKKAQPKPQQKTQAKEEPRLQKPPSEMTAAELIEYNKKVVAARQQGKKAVALKKMPMPDSQQLETMYATRVQTQGGGNLIGAILTKMGKGAPGLVENVGGQYDDSNDGRM